MLAIYESKTLMSPLTFTI